MVSIIFIVPDFSIIKIQTRKVIRFLLKQNLVTLHWEEASLLFVFQIYGTGWLQIWLKWIQCINGFDRMCCFKKNVDFDF